MCSNSLRQKNRTNGRPGMNGVDWMDSWKRYGLGGVVYWPGLSNGVEEYSEDNLLYVGLFGP